MNAYEFDFDPNPQPKSEQATVSDDYIKAMAKNQLPAVDRLAQKAKEQAIQELEWKINECRRNMIIFVDRGQNIPNSTYERIQELEQRIENIRNNVQRKAHPNMMALHTLKNMRDKMYYLGISDYNEWIRVKNAHSEAMAGEYPDVLMDQIQAAIDSAIGNISEAA